MEQNEAEMVAEVPPPEPEDKTAATSEEDDARLDVALQGQEPTVKNLILAAIGVMKSRKARPDCKRISNWINRRYGKSSKCVEDELERLVQVGELARVDYKGSASFRIVNPAAKAKRRRRGNKPLGRTPSRHPVALGGLFTALDNAEVQQQQRQPFHMQALTLRTLVLEMLGDSAAASIEAGITVNMQFIAKAVEATGRNISRAAILGNLDLILANEVESGCFVRVGEDQYRLPPNYNPHPQVLNPPLAHPPPEPVPVQQLIMDRQARNAMEQQQQHAIHRLATLTPEKTVVDNGRSDEQKKNDLIAAKLSRMTSSESKTKSPSKKVSPENLNDKIKTEALPIKEEKVDEDENLGGVLRRNRGGGKSVPDKTAKKKKKREDEIKLERHAVDLTQAAAVEAIPRPGSARKKKSRKIFDPADHEQPSRKRKATSPVQQQQASIVDVMESSPLRSPEEPLALEEPDKQEVEIPMPILDKPPISCMYCGISSPKFNKKGRVDPLLNCRDCTTIVHPSCMDYSDELTRKILNNPWRCINCKTCSVCQEANNDDCMLFCDSCDLGYHMACHRPPLLNKPIGKWECSNCVAHLPPPPPPPAVVQAKGRSSRNNSTENNAVVPNGHHSYSGSSPDDDETARFLSILPPHVHPHTGLLPDNWEDYEEDPNIPDVAEWQPKQISDYFASHGFSSETSNVFLDQEIDGRSLLLLHRTDVVSSLGLKLGPALKVFSHVKKLQTRRNFPDY